MPIPFPHRPQAGKVLAQALRSLAGCSGLLVLALPHDGVPVGFEVAQALGAPLDLMAIQPLLAAPGSHQGDMALGLLSHPPALQLHEATLNALQVSEGALRRSLAQARRVLRRRLQAMRPVAPPPELAGRTVVLVDDGVAAGRALLRAAGLARRAGAREVVVAVPVGAAPGLRRLAGAVDSVVCLQTPEPFISVATAYEDFQPVTDAEVHALLARAWGRQPATPRAAAAHTSP